MTTGVRRSAGLAVSIALAALSSAPAFSQSWPGETWPESVTPEAMGMDSALLTQAQEYSQGTNLEGSGFVVRDGVLVHQWGDQSVLYDVKSVTKSIGSAALVLALDQNLVELDATARTYFPTLGTPPETNPADQLDTITVEQLATHSAGFEKPGGFCTLQSEPGTEWAYSDCGLNWLADVLTVEFENDLYAVLFDNIFTPIGIAKESLIWRTNRFRRPNRLSINNRRVSRREFASGISADVQALARFGLLFERDGQWRGEQILPAGVSDLVGTPRESIASLPIREPATLHPNATEHYGLLWWTNTGASAIAGVPSDAYWAWGLGDSLIFVIPSLDLVVVRTGPIWNNSTTCGNRNQTLCSDYGVLEDFIGPIVAAVGPVPANNAPEVDVGADQQLILSTHPTDTLALLGVVTDDITPVNQLDLEWSVVSGPDGGVNFSTPNDSLTTDATFTAAGTYVIQLSATDTSITASDQLTVTVLADPTPTLSFSASPTLISQGTSTTLTWDAENADTCTASGGWEGAKDADGGEEEIELEETTDFTLECTNASGTTGPQTVTVEVEADAPPTTVTLEASSASIDSGDSVTLTWSTSEATSCLASGGWEGTKATEGEEEVGPLTEDTTFTLTCTGTEEVSDEVTVTINDTPPPSNGGGGGGGAIGWWLLAMLLSAGGVRAARGLRSVSLR